MGRMFILQKAFPVQIVPMRGSILTLLVVSGLSFAPEDASAREVELAESSNCQCKSQRRIVRPLTESLPIRKKDKDRVRRILM